jgi:hypothetical protein
MGTDIVSRPYRLNRQIACEACTFGSGLHAPFCPKWTPYTLEDDTPLVPGPSVEAERSDLHPRGSARVK